MGGLDRTRSLGSIVDRCERLLRLDSEVVETATFFFLAFASESASFAGSEHGEEISALQRLADGAPLRPPSDLNETVGADLNAVVLQARWSHRGDSPHRGSSSQRWRGRALSVFSCGQAAEPACRRGLEVTSRSDSASCERLRDARFPDITTLDQFDFTTADTCPHAGR